VAGYAGRAGTLPPLACLPVRRVAMRPSACRLLEPTARLAGAVNPGVAITEWPANAAGIPICQRQ